MSEKRVDSRYRNFALIVYPDSAPVDWLDILSSFCVSAFVSPLHDSDVNPDGEPKKPHWHVMLMFEGKKSIDQVVGLISQLGGVGCQHVNSVRGYARYLCHLDNPEKYQYNQADVQCLSGADYIGTIGLAIDKYKALGEMQDFCEQYNIVSFYLLSKYARINRPDWYRILCDCGAVYMREYLKSKQWSAENQQISIVDPETGEVIL